MIVTFKQSVKYALAGLRSFFGNERNGRIQALVAILTITASIILDISSLEWILVIICTCLVLVLEMINTAIEKVCNLITPDFHPQLKLIKDISAGAVLLAATGSAIIGLIIFIPHLLKLFS